jgi:hypothetical protein
VLTLPYELRKLAAFKADVLTALARIFVESTFATYRARAKKLGIDDPECGAVNFVQRFGSLNLHVHFHLLVLDGVFARDAEGRLVFHASPPPSVDDLKAVVARTARLSTAWLTKHSYVDDSPLEDRSNESPTQTALHACVAIAMGRGTVATLPRNAAQDDAQGDEDHHDTAAVAVESEGFNLHAAVRVEAGDDVGRERLARYGARPPLSLERLRRLPGGRVTYRLKYVSRGRGKHRVMGGVEFLARLAAIIAPPRYPLTRFAGVLAPRSKWRRHVVPKPRERTMPACKSGDVSTNVEPKPHPARTEPKASRSDTSRGSRDEPAAQGGSEGSTPARAGGSPRAATSTAASAVFAPASPDVTVLASNVISVRHWDRLVGGLLYAVAPRVDWAKLIRRTFAIDVLECSKCRGRLRMISIITQREPVHAILAHLGMPTEAPPLARARDPTDDGYDDDSPQLDLALR